MKKSNTQAMSLLVLPIILFFLMIITLDSSPGYYVLGQIVGGVFFAQAFILTHEFGHRSMFKNNTLNKFFGHIFSFFIFIPYYNWLEIHDLHHKWTGFRDKDPTTEKTFADRLNKRQQAIINIAWKYYIPVFTLGYRFGIYWKAEKLKRHLSVEKYKRCIRSMWIYGIIYLTTLVIFPSVWLKVLPALYISFIICDIISLSQHSHIEMQHSKGEDVKPLKYSEQAHYSRSLNFPTWISEYLLFNFNYHEAHHVYPGLPCYYLNRIKVDSSNNYDFLPWLKTVKSVSGVNFVFKSSSNRDF